ncbi:MAG: hypothetical protein M3071_07900 [Actinomycetota bacterium]|nr:hypothetical protein [Actinomycetota bacterium]
MSEGDGGHDSFEERLRALAREVGESVERMAGSLDRDEIADRIGTGGERVRELAEFAGRWLKAQGEDHAARGSAPADDAVPVRLSGPHPRDVPTEEQGLALSALDSGRWKVDAGTNELISDGQGPGPSQRGGLVDELRARDWITAGGEVTLVGRAALRRWEDGPPPS